MPIFGGKKPKTPNESSQHADTLDVAVGASEEPTPDTSPAYRRRKVQFYCQLAQGSPTGIISDFADIKELYSEVASCYGIDASEVVFVIVVP